MQTLKSQIYKKNKRLLVKKLYVNMYCNTLLNTETVVEIEISFTEQF